MILNYTDYKSNCWIKARTTKITLDGILRVKIIIMLSIKKLSKSFLLEYVIPCTKKGLKFASVRFDEIFLKIMKILMYSKLNFFENPFNKD